MEIGKGEAYLATWVGGSQEEGDGLTSKSSGVTRLTWSGD